MGFQIKCKGLGWKLEAIVQILLKILRRKDPKQEESSQSKHWEVAGWLAEAGVLGPPFQILISNFNVLGKHLHRWTRSIGIQIEQRKNWIEWHELHVDAKSAYIIWGLLASRNFTFFFIGRCLFKNIQ